MYVYIEQPSLVARRILLSPNCYGVSANGGVVTTWMISTSNILVQSLTKTQSQENSMLEWLVITVSKWVTYFILSDTIHCSQMVGKFKDKLHCMNTSSSIYMTSHGMANKTDSLRHGLDMVIRRIRIELIFILQNQSSDFVRSSAYSTAQM